MIDDGAARPEELLVLAKAAKGRELETVTGKRFFVSPRRSV